MANKTTKISALENRLFNPNHLIPILGLRGLDKDIKIKDEQDTKAPACEHIRRLEDNTGYEIGVVLYHSIIASAVITTSIALAPAAYDAIKKLF